MPDGNNYEFQDDKEAATALNRWDAPKQAAQLSPSQIEAQKQRAMESMARSEYPGLSATRDFFAGVNTIPRSVVGLFGGENPLSAEGVDKQSTAYLLGSIADPSAAVLGFGAGSLIPKTIQAARPVVGSILGGAAAGGATGAISEDSTATEGAILGGVVGGVVPQLAHVGSKISQLFGQPEQQVMRYLRDIFPDDVSQKEAAKALNELSPIVPGEQVTAGIASVSGQTRIPALKALQTGAEGRPTASQSAANIDMRSEEARSKVLDWIIKPGATPPAGFGEKIAPSMAEAARKNITTPLYSKALAEKVPVDDHLMEILSGPMLGSFKSDAFTKVNQAIINTGGKVKPAFGAGTPERLQGVPEWSLEAPYKVTPAKPGTVSILMLKNLRDDLVKRVNQLNNVQDASGKTEKALLLDAKIQLDGWMRSKSQGWKDAQETFAFLSQPQNQADVAKVLQKALQAPTGAERVGSFLEAMRSAPSTLKSGLGETRYEQLSQVMTPIQIREINKLAESLKRTADYERLGGASGILPEQLSLGQKLSKRTPEMLQKEVTIFKSILGRSGAALTKKAQEYLDNLVINDPKGLGILLSKLDGSQRQVVKKFLSERAGIAAAMAGTAGAQ